MITEINADGLRNAMALLEDARQARAAVQKKLDAAQREMGDIEVRLGAAREELRNEEAEIAASGARMPDNPSPVEGRIALLARHQRILTTRRGLIEQQELKPADDQVRAAREAIQQEWRKAGRQQTEAIRARYSEAARVLQGAYAEYCLWMWEFQSDAAASDFPPPNRWQDIPRLTGHGPLEGLIALNSREKFDRVAPDLVARICELRAEIDACKKA
jgi:DNA repair exonuclease SbcCD ATPase subunit